MPISVLKYKYKWEIHTFTETTPVSLPVLSKDSFRCCPNFKLSRNLTRKMFAGKSSMSFSTRILHSGHRNSLLPWTISLKHCLQKVCWHGKNLQVSSNCLKQTGHSKSSVTCPESMTAIRGVRKQIDDRKQVSCLNCAANFQIPAVNTRLIELSFDGRNFNCSCTEKMQKKEKARSSSFIMFVASSSSVLRHPSCFRQAEVIRKENHMTFFVRICIINVVRICIINVRATVHAFLATTSLALKIARIIHICDFFIPSRTTALWSPKSTALIGKINRSLPTSFEVFSSCIHTLRTSLLK